MAVFSMRPLQLALPTGISTRPRQSTPTPVRRCRAFSHFEGMHTHTLLTCSTVVEDVELTSLVQNGATVFAMRHGRKLKKLNKPADQRKALIRGLVTELLRHGKIKTTTARAKAIRPFVDKMVGLAKRGDLHARRRALGFIYDKALVRSLFDKVPDRYPERTSGFTRVIKEIKHRRGDNAEMSTIELV